MSRERLLNRHSMSRRYDDEPQATERLLNRHDYSRREATQPKYSDGGDQGAGSICGDCTTPAGTDDVDLDDIAIGLKASRYYEWSPFCGDLIRFRMTYAGLVDGKHTWLGTSDDPLTVNCTGEGDTTFAARIVVSNYLPTGVEGRLTDGTNTWKAHNEVSWQPKQETPLIFDEGPAPDACPCSPLKEAPCLEPKDCSDVTESKQFTVTGSTGYDGVYWLRKGRTPCEAGVCCWSAEIVGPIGAKLTWDAELWTLEIDDGAAVYTVAGELFDDPIVLNKDSGPSDMPATITVTII